MIHRVRAGCYALAALFVGGCLFSAYDSAGPAPNLTEQDIVGTWVNEWGPRFTFAGDGRFDMAGMSACSERDPYRHHDQFDAGAGTWGLDSPTSGQNYQDILLTFDLRTERESVWWTMRAERDELFFFLGDPDDNQRCSFARQPASPG